jgi:hypothetical protein
MTQPAANFDEAGFIASITCPLPAIDAAFWPICAFSAARIEARYTDA